MGRGFWLGELGVLVCLGLGLAWPPMFVAAGVLQGAVVIRQAVRAMRALEAYEADAAANSDAPSPD